MLAMLLLVLLLLFTVKVCLVVFVTVADVVDVVDALVIVNGVSVIVVGVDCSYVSASVDVVLCVCC